MPEHLQRADVRRSSSAGETKTITLEVAQHIGDDMVRAISLKPTDGLVRGGGAATPASRSPCPSATSPRARCSTPSATCLNLEEGETLEITERWGIHRKAPAFDQLESKTQMFETGIKVIDLLTPYVQGGKIGLFGGAGVGKTVLIQEMIAARRAGPRWCVGVRRCRRAHP